jgi:hypothetical protein
MIEELRKLDGYDSTYESWSDIPAPIQELLDCYESVHSELEEGGRWSNYKTNVYKVEENGETAYFSVWREVPATVYQEGGDFGIGMDEVVPKEVTTIKYITKGDD